MQKWRTVGSSTVVQVGATYSFYLGNGFLLISLEYQIRDKSTTVGRVLFVP